MKGRSINRDPAIEPYRAEEPPSIDDTFATTLSGIEKLRAGHYRNEDDWREWKRSVLASLKAGSAVERKLAWVIPELKGAARDSALQALARRVESLETARSKVLSTWQQALSIAGKVALVILAALASRLIKL